TTTPVARSLKLASRCDKFSKSNHSFPALMGCGVGHDSGSGGTMPGTRLNSLFGAALSFQRWDPRPDEELLACFLDPRDESAVEALWVRHAPGVRAACVGWRRSSADIEDAAQATFLVLVQRAGAIRDRRAVGRWLYASQPTSRGGCDSSKRRRSRCPLTYRSV